MNLGTILEPLRAAIAADAAWVALTGNAGIVLESPINGTPTAPFAKWAVAGALPQLDLEGLDRVRLDVTFFGLTRAQVRGMDDYFATAFSIPRHAQISVTGYRLFGLRRLRSHEMPVAVQLQAGGAWLLATVAEYELRVSKAV